MSYRVAVALEEALASLKQWSNVSTGVYDADSVAMLSSDGFATTSEQVTDLIADAYVLSAQIYLQCRVFR